MNAHPLPIKLVAMNLSFFQGKYLGFCHFSMGNNRDFATFPMGISMNSPFFQGKYWNFCHFSKICGFPYFLVGTFTDSIWGRVNVFDRLLRRYRATFSNI